MIHEHSHPKDFIASNTPSLFVVLSSIRVIVKRLDMSSSACQDRMSTIEILKLEPGGPAEGSNFELRLVPELRSALTYAAVQRIWIRLDLFHISERTVSKLYL